MEYQPHNPTKIDEEKLLEAFSVAQTPQEHFEIIRAACKNAYGDITDEDTNTYGDDIDHYEVPLTDGRILTFTNEEDSEVARVQKNIPDEAAILTTTYRKDADSSSVTKLTYYDNY